MLIRNLAEHARHRIFSLPLLRSNGVDHINCQLKIYWKTIFLKHGCHPNEIISEKIRSNNHERPPINELIPQISHDLMIFTPHPSLSFASNQPRK